MAPGSSHDETRGMNTLERPLGDRILGGVCAGLARRFGLKPLTVRVLFLLSLLLPGPQVLAYILMWIIIPSEQRDVRAA